jgi:hypothetical protein
MRRKPRVYEGVLSPIVRRMRSAPLACQSPVRRISRKRAQPAARDRHGSTLLRPSGRRLRAASTGGGLRREQDCDADHMSSIVRSVPVLGHTARHIRLRRQKLKLCDVGGASPSLACAAGSSANPPDPSSPPTSASGADPLAARPLQAAGECAKNIMYMAESCTTSCGTCASKRSACDRPDDTPPLVQEGGVSATMQRILDEFPQYNPRAISRPGHGPKGDESPWVITLESFVSDEEACLGPGPRSPTCPRCHPSARSARYFTNAVSGLLIPRV